MEIRTTPPRADTPLWPMVGSICAWCHVFPCACPRTEPCACGGMIVAGEDVAMAVRLHNGTDLHRVWRDRRAVTDGVAVELTLPVGRLVP